ncbi:uncharacterized protein [Spinacia oleracea]|uniref:Reverse transcriptase domain-containing protein n=1 Tax=Spinacia oleracea TaxID=3562 RepID=A0ABM3QRP0_SPIOL|nr:uncharacterized protein LOC130461836 [Spinacia oleracea]
MPTYSRFLKVILSGKRDCDVKETVNLTENCSAIILNQMPPNLKDPGSFSIPCAIKALENGNAICDLGASVSLMPYSVFTTLDIGELVPTNMTLQLADRLVKYPIGKVEDVPLRVSKFVIPVDFVVLDIDEDAHVPIILGRPFLATAGAIINVKQGVVTLKRVGVGNVGVEAAQYKEQLNTTPLGEECCVLLDREDVLDDLKQRNGKEAPKVELKALPSSLRYVFLGPNSSYPVIVNASLDDEQVLQLVQVWRRHQSALGYTINDLKGISPTLCMHHIELEDNAISHRERQRMINPPMGEVVKKEIVKLLAARIIYPISNSRWVSPVHVVPKKSGMTVVKNAQGELISTRTVTGWRMCIDYCQLNLSTKKDHFPLPFIDQILERLTKHKYFSFLDGYSGFFQISINPEDQEKTTFTCPYGTFAYRKCHSGFAMSPGRSKGA